MKTKQLELQTTLEWVWWESYYMTTDLKSFILYCENDQKFDHEHEVVKNLIMNVSSCQGLQQERNKNSNQIKNYQSVSGTKKQRIVVLHINW